MREQLEQLAEEVKAAFHHINRDMKAGVIIIDPRIDQRTKARAYKYGAFMSLQQFECPKPKSGIVYDNIFLEMHDFIDKIKSNEPIVTWLATEDYDEETIKLTPDTDIRMAVKVENAFGSPESVEPSIHRAGNPLTDGIGIGESINIEDLIK